PGTNEDTPLRQVQSFEYNISKVLAEQKLSAMSKDGVVECVILRPCIVFGPRSTFWTAQIASDILSDRAYLIDGGAGICNTVYVDNLVELMCLCATHPAARGRAYLVRDQERVTWLTLYSSIADALRLDVSQIASVPRSVAAEFFAVPNAPLTHRLIRC